MSYGGITFDPTLDEERLNEQSLRIYRLMTDSHWRSLAEIHAVTGDPEASISARLRDLRKPEFGGFTVDRQRRAGLGTGTWEYRLRPATAPTGKPAVVARNPFLEGVMFATRQVLKAADLPEAKSLLRTELRTLLKR